MDEDHEQRRKELEDSPPAFRDSLLVPKQAQAALLVRLGDSDLRQLRFITDLLMKLKAGKQASGRRPGPEKRGISDDLIENAPTYKSSFGISHDVAENKRS